ncbi:MAG: phospholipase [Muribaculaceae bacterium]
MTVVLIIAAALVAVGLPLYLLHKREERKAGGELPITPPQQECCGLHLTCEKDSLLAAVSEEIVYYDDEELDKYKGRLPDSYDEEEIEQFRNVLLTMLPQDTAGWARSLQLREICLPDAVKEELLMIVAEARAAKTST